MSIKLHTIKSAAIKKKRKTIGRGNASGHGSYSTRGIKGQRARSGVGGLRLKGMKHIILSTPKLRGFKSMHAKFETVNIAKLQDVFTDGDTVNAATLFEKGLVSSAVADVKIIGGGEFSRKVIVSGCKLSSGAKMAIEKAGGKIS
jgi:large subunit ribosomal protein L15